MRERFTMDFHGERLLRSFAARVGTERVLTAKKHLDPQCNACIGTSEINILSLRGISLIHKA
jgi:hypothetical protein